MKKIVFVLLAVMLVFTLTACTDKLEEAKAETVTRKINALGEIELSSRPAIEKAERAYFELDMETREFVPNYLDILRAKETYKQLRIERIQGRIQDAQAAFDETWNTWTLFYTLRDIRKDCHPDEEYLVDEAVAKNEELCFEGTHFIHFDNLLKADKDIVFLENDWLAYVRDGIDYYSWYQTYYVPQTAGELGDSYYQLRLAYAGASNVWGEATKLLDEHLKMYQMEETVLYDWGPGNKIGAYSIIYADDLGNKLCYTDSRTSDEYYIEIFIRPAKAFEPAASAEQPTV